MLAKVLSGAVVGLDAVPITVEVDIASQGLPSFTIVGLPDKAVEESRERVRSAIKNSGAEFPAQRITVNLAPADLPKVGPAYDLPIAVGILIASEQLKQPPDDTLYLGELSLDGSIRHTNGVLPIAFLAKDLGKTSVYLPAVDAREASVTPDIQVYPASSLGALWHHLMGLSTITPHPYMSYESLQGEVSFEFDMSEIHGQEHVKRGLEIGAAGGHNVFMQGPPGAGKTLLARTLPSILPSMTQQEALEVTKIYSVTGNLPLGTSIVSSRPFRAPHHTTSRIGLVGGGAHPVPGEISLAHRGVLFLDEFPEFPRHVLEALRQPMEDGIVSISRAAGTVQYPAKFMLVGAANPCPCGNHGSMTKRCTCPMGTVSRYEKRISGPIMDRIDLTMSVPAVKVEKLTYEGGMKPESSASIRVRVQKARERAVLRLEKFMLASNAEMSNKMVKELCPLTSEVQAFLRSAVGELGLSARSYYRVIKVARTVADLSGERDIALPHVAEALQHRPRDTK
ncbi:YifB family Mg chelatase-like AAA ATPase [Candidatus Gottesmanbacteria bacterium]|nr:YifB family Mg chelatase-like AAA ATPase [Candidatus Gottesmanbacteria bacterium]